MLRYVLDAEAPATGPAGLSPGVLVLFTILFILLSAGLAVFLFFGIRKERNRYISEKLKTENTGKDGFDEMLARRMKFAKKNTHFTVMLVKLLGAEALFRSLGQKQYHSVLIQLEDRLCMILPKGVKISIYEKDTIALCFDGDLDRKAVSDLSVFAISECQKSMTLITKVNVTPEVVIGSAIYGYEKNLSADQFFTNARHALMEAEAKGRGSFVVYAPEEDFSGEENVQFYKDVRRAVENGEFSLGYQPILSMDKQLVAYESFLRWNHPEYGMMHATRFLPILLQTGDIQRIGMEAFTKLCITAANYRSAHEGSSVLFSMNFSTRQLLLPSFADDLFRILKRHHLSPSDLCIEVSDFKTPDVLDNLKRLRDLGFHVAVDGFNLEGSSDTLTELQSLSPEWIKLHSSFVKQCGENFFAKGMVEMLVKFAAQESIKIIVTGVETAEEAERAKELGIGYGQGNYFGVETKEL